MPYGYNGKILHVDLTSGALEVEEPPESFYRKYMGGSAMGLYYILKDMPQSADALGPENILTLMCSVTTGVPISGQSRINANAKSPLTGAIGDSQAGGFFPAELKFAGFDGIVVRGRSEKPVYLSILHGEAELHDASHLMGKITGEVDQILRQAVDDPKAEIMQCGIAAERGVRFASIVNMSNRHNGRTGMGLVMASKNLKAIVVRGKQRVQAFDAREVTALNRLGPRWMPENADVEDLNKYGTAGVLVFQNSIGSLPTRNYNEGQFEAAEAISGETMSNTILKENDTCYACVVRCKRVVEVQEGAYQSDSLYGGPEYETLSTFGSYCGIDDLKAIALANQLCNQYGADTIAAGATIAFAMECYEKGIIGLEQTGGLQLRFGDADAMLAALVQMLNNEGPLGEAISQGSQRAAELWGEAARDCLITVKGSEAPAHMPHAKKSLSLIYAVNPFGADHQSSEHDPMYEGDISDLYRDRLAELGLTNPPEPGSLGTEKIRFAALTQRFYSLLDTLELCQFVWGPAWTLYGPLELVRFLNACTGWDATVAEIVQIGERRLNMLRLFNAREGLDRKADKLPKKFFKALQGTGPTAGHALDEDEFDRVLDAYYEFAGWTPDGVPTPAKLAELGLEWAA
ncbi:MAG: aldehyde ferredoxin oxidoreductase family protein [Anaerolineales bacterium]